MSSFAIGWEYLTGYAVATHPSSRDRAEWPPHPGRVFLALAAAYFETGEERAEGDALRWLETLRAPELLLPACDGVFERANVTAFVPVNDKAGPSAATLHSAPAVTRTRQARTFPRAWVGHAPCYMVWAKANGIEMHRPVLDRLCAKVSRIGHSSSLVRMWVADDADVAAGERWIVDDALATAHCRVVSANTLDSLPEQTNIARIEEHAQFAQRIKSCKGKALKAAKTEYEQRFGAKWKASAAPPPLLRPKLGIWRGYRPARRAERARATSHTIFDTDLLILSQSAGPQLPVVSTLATAAALRGAIMRHSGVQPAPAWVSGHESNGEHLQSTDDGHLAIFPLPFVGHPHADGHLLGMGLAFPRSTTPQQRGRVLGPVLLAEGGELRDVQLKLGRLGKWTLTKRDWSEPRRALQSETWTAHPDGAIRWASVTPVVLDKFPKADRRNNQAEWTEEVCDIIAAACERIRLPRPVAVDIDTTSWHFGSPRAIQKQRPLRGRPRLAERTTTGWGEGFPYYPARGTNAPRPQIHVWLWFAEPVLGPVLLGAGRYRGYGLCMPVKEGRP
jgi:CRISPR-associated protein Csb2